nr:PREDICTED: uncharacterized protein LOC102119475 [Macaca fascicularis]
MFQLYKSRDLRMQITSPQFLTLRLAMGTSNIFLCVLFLCGALGLTMSPARGRLRCYTCSLAKSCYPVLTKCQDDESCSISIGTSGRALVQWPFSRRLPTSIHPAFPVAPASACLLHPTDQSEIIERKGYLPRAQCPLPSHATYWLHSYILRHHCC